MVFKFPHGTQLSESPTLLKKKKNGCNTVRLVNIKLKKKKSKYLNNLNRIVLDFFGFVFFFPRLARLSSTSSLCFHQVDEYKYLMFFPNY